MGSCLSSCKKRYESEKAPVDDVPLQKFKILLLGAGESGKSTVLKQVRLIHKGKMPPKDVKQCADAIRKNAVESMQAVLQAMTAQGISLANKSNLEAQHRIVCLPEDAPFTQEIADDITQLWSDSGVKMCYDKRELYWLLDAAAYYFNEVQRIAKPTYEPTENDVIMARVRTTGIDSAEFIEPPYGYSVVDVGGQRNERRKWVHCFENVKAVVYLVGLSGYNQYLFEENGVNRMQESLRLFQQVVSNPIFKDTPIFLFLNKRDLFEQMIKETSLKVCFPEYTGPEGDVKSALKFVQKTYVNILKESCPEKDIYIKVVAARDRKDMEDAWLAVKTTLRDVYKGNSNQSHAVTPDSLGSFEGAIVA